MALIVHKYGGTSMGSPERIRNVAKRVAKWARAGHQMVVVPSAMSGETNRLLGLAKEVNPGLPDDAAMRELDMIAATGEQVSVGLLALALQAEGMAAVSYAGWQVPVHTDSSYTKARIASIESRLDIHTLEALEANELAVNEIGRVVIETQQPLPVEAYVANRSGGSLIIVDPTTNRTSGALLVDSPRA